MNRFRQLLPAKKAFIPFFVLGDPSLAMSLEYIKAAIDAGADALEIGIPFSDPIADGPVIQASAKRALDAGADLTACCELLTAIRAYSDCPIGLLMYYNPLFTQGEKLYKQLAAAGAHAILAVDLPLEEAAEHEALLAKHDLGCVHLIAPNTPKERAEKLLAHSSAYAYVVSRYGVTGVHSQMQQNLPERLSSLKELSDTPLAVGFGISDAKGVEQVIEAGADAAIIGSAITKIINNHLSNPSNATAEIKTLVAQCKIGEKPC